MSTIFSMHVSAVLFPWEVLHKELETINGLHFTSREIDVIALLLTGRSSKMIASLFSISQRTVETHIRNIKHKLGANSKEAIINFIEKSGKGSLLEEHRNSLLEKKTFEKLLKENSRFLSNKVKGHIFYNKERNRQRFAEQLAQHFEMLGIQTTVESFKLGKIENLKALNSQSCITLYIIDNINFEELNQGILPDSSAYYRYQNNVLLSLYDIVSLAKNGPINLTVGTSNYYGIFSHFLNYIFQNSPYKVLLKEIDEFKLISDKPTVGYSTEPLKLQNFVPKHGWIKRQRALISIAIGLTILCLAALNYGKAIINTINNPSISSKLSIPNENILLARSRLLNEMNAEFKNTKGIHTIALTGIGGGGKTTLARQYLSQQRAPLSWEINASTRDSLVASFKDLANILAANKAEKIYLNDIQENVEQSKREVLLADFIRKKLKDYSHWFLLFDNVQRVTDLQPFLPNDSKQWGKGKILITSRNSNIHQSTYVNKALPVGELSLEEMAYIFEKIVGEEFKQKYLATDLFKVLKQIPPFPLDVSLAAYYFLSTHTGIDHYINNKNKDIKRVEYFQEQIMKEIGDYKYSRFEITTKTMQEIIRDNKDLTDIFVLISLITPDNISYDLLTSFQESSLVDKFIYISKKYSLISRASSANILSVHTSIQDIILVYLQENYLSLNPNCIVEIANLLREKLIDAINNENAPLMREMVSHCEKFLERVSALPPLLRTNLQAEMGGAYSHLGNNNKALLLLEECLTSLNQIYGENHINTARPIELLAFVVNDMGDYHRARTLFEQCLALYMKSSSDETSVGRILEQLGIVYSRLGNYKKSIDMLNQSLHFFSKISPQRYDYIARVLGFSGYVHKIIGDYQNSHKLLLEGLTAAKAYHPPSHFRIGWLELHLGDLLLELRDYKNAEIFIRNGLKIYGEYFSEQSLKVAWALSLLGKFDNNSGKYQEAKEHFERCLIIYRDHFPEDHQNWIGGILTQLGETLLNLGDYPQAEKILNQALLIAQESYGHNHLLVAESTRLLGNIQYQKNDDNGAEQLLKKALEVYQADNHPHIYKCYEDLGNLYVKKMIAAILNTDWKIAAFYRQQSTLFFNHALKIARSFMNKESLYISALSLKIKIINSVDHF